MSCIVLLTLKCPVGVISLGSSITFFSLRVLSSTTTMADFLSAAFQTANQTSSPALLYSGCTTRLAPSPRLAHSAIGNTVTPLSRLLMSSTPTDWLILASLLSGASTHRFFDFGWLLMNSDPL